MDRTEQQAAGTHPAPCARHCEANAFQIEIRRAWASYESAVEAGKKLAQQALKAEQERDCAVHALTRAGHTLAEGAAEWKPPIGPAATPLLDKINKISSERDAIAAELKALREQAPAAWVNPSYAEPAQGCTYSREDHERWPHIYSQPLYAHPVPARELTDAIIGQIYIKAAAHIEHATQREIAFARAIERHLRGDAP